MANFLEGKRLFGARLSLQSFISVASRYILPLIGTIPVSELTSQDLWNLLRLIESTPPKVGANPSQAPVDPATMDPEMRRKRRVTANNVYSALRSALNMAWQEGKVDQDTAWRRVDRFRDVYNCRPDILNREQCRDLPQVSPLDIQKLVLAALFTGCRVTELLNIRVEDVNRGRKAVYIRPLKVYRARHVALPAEGHAFFESLAHGRGGQEILLRRANGSPWRRSTYANYLKAACKKAGIPDRIVFHAFRHTYASWLIQAGTSPLVVARQLGHANIMSVVRTYAHCTDDFIDHELRRKFRPNLLEGLGMRAQKSDRNRPATAKWQTSKTVTARTAATSRWV